MKPITLIALLIVFLSACTRATPTPTVGATGTPALAPELQAYLDQAIDLIQGNSIYAAGSDWESIRAQADEAAAGAQTTADLYPILVMALHATGDRHGYVMPPAEANASFGAAQPESLPDFKYELREDHFAYIFVPSFESGNMETAVAFAGQLQKAIRALDAQQPCGWVLDLRGNEGGNGFAMLLGVSPLLEEGTVAAYTYNGGTAQNISIQGGQIFLGDMLIMELDQPAYRLDPPGAPVAVLTAQATTSAGELVAIAFRGWPNTRSFGQKTLGRTTAPQGFIMEDGAILGISVAYFTDHTGQVYQGQIDPEGYVPPPVHNNPNYWDDSIPQQAIDWLLGQDACKGK